MGWLTYQALLNRDIPLIQATVFVIAAVVMLANLVVDLLYLYSIRASGWSRRGEARSSPPKGLIGAALVIRCSGAGDRRPLLSFRPISARG